MHIESAHSVRKSAISEAQCGSLQSVLDTINRAPWDGQWRFQVSLSLELSDDERIKAKALAAAINSEPHLTAEFDGQVDGTWIVVHRDEQFYLERQQDLLEQLNGAIRARPFEGKWTLDLPRLTNEDSLLAVQLRQAIENDGQYSVAFELIKDAHRHPHFLVKEKT